MSVFESRRFTKIFSSFRKKTSQGQKLSRKMFSSFKEKSSTKPLLRKLSLRSKSSSKTDYNVSIQLWKNNPLYESANQISMQSSTNEVEWAEVHAIMKNESELDKQSSSSSGVSSGSSVIYSHSSNRSGISTNVMKTSPEHICSSHSELSDISTPKHIKHYNATYEPTEDGSLLIVNNQCGTTITTDPPTPTVPSTYAKLWLVRQRISSSSHSDADYEIYIDEYYNSKLQNGSSSDIHCDDKASSDDSYHDFYNDLVDDIQYLLIHDKPYFTDSIQIGILESIH